MSTSPLKLLALQSALRPASRDILRAAAAGATWGAVLTAGLTGMTAAQCGGVCLPEVAANAALALAGGIFGIGPLVLYGRRPV